MSGLIWFAVVTLLGYFLIDIILIVPLRSGKAKPLQNKSQKAISVIIASKNEAHNLKKFLPKILNQNHHNFEVILVNDHSTDETSSVLSSFKLVYPHLKIIDNSFSTSKKNAIYCGIQQAKHENLVFTDADCRPLSQDWLSEIQHCFSDEKSIVLGYSPYKKQKGWLNKIIRYETLQTAINYFGMAKLGVAYMGVGRNLGYSKSIFKALQGFKRHEHLLSGDDDLLINEASGRYPIDISLDPKTFVESLPKTNFRTWIRQKQRHMTTAPYYKLKHRLLLGFQFFLRFLFWFFVLPLCIYLCYAGQPKLLILICFGVVFKLCYTRFLFSNFLVKDLWLASFLFEFQLICLQLYIFSLNLITPKKDW
jgi:glycosyltransferase involved in cell wall biosynthesis